MDMKRFWTFFLQIIKILDDYKVLVALILLVWLLGFASKNSVFRLVKLDKQIKALKEQKVDLERRIVEDSLYIRKLDTDDEAFERYLRERYYFHQPNEDIYIIRER